MPKVVVDLTQVLPNGENGGAKIMVIELLKQLSLLAPQYHFVLLTSYRAHEELSILDSNNVERICIFDKLPELKRYRKYFTDLFKKIAEQIFPDHDGLLTEAKLDKDNVLKSFNADLLFCPFTEQIFPDSALPRVTIIYDLQHLYYQHFFDETQIFYRDKFFRDACLLSSQIVCISDFVRSAVIKECGAIDQKNIKTIHIAIKDRVANNFLNDKKELFLSKIGLSSNRFLFYPANFWKHKNHEKLFKGFKLYKNNHPLSDLKLVCTGTIEERLQFLKNFVADLEMSNDVIFAGYVNDEELSILYNECMSLIFPSLYEGFGMPVLEAMAAGKCVICSNAASLPEIAGDAALFFDPNEPSSIAEAIFTIEKDRDLMKELVAKGYSRVSLFGDRRRMAKEYLKVFDEALHLKSQPRSFLFGHYLDGWVGKKLTISIEPGKESREIVIEVTAPGFLPYRSMKINLLDEANSQSKDYILIRGRNLTIRRQLSNNGSCISINSSNSFQPKQYGIGSDERILAYVIKSCFISSSMGKYDLFSNRSEML